MSTRPAAFVTGAKRGIGRGIALALAGAGFDIVVNDLAEDDDARATLADIRALGAEAAFIAGDIADLDRQEALVSGAWNEFGGIDCHVNNAGVSVLNRGDLLDMTVESYDRCLDINLRGTFFLTQKIARRMLDAKSERGPRSIVNITSVSATVVSLARGEYCMSKAGLSMLTKLFALRLADHRIGVYEIRPGIIRTDMTKASAARFDTLIADGYTPIRRWGEPDDIGRTAVMLATGALPFTVGQVLEIDGGLAMRAL